MTTLTIEFNGSKWAGEEPDSIEVLLRALRKDALDSCNCRKCWPDKDQPRNGRKRSQVRP